MIMPESPNLIDENGQIPPPTENKPPEVLKSETETTTAEPAQPAKNPAEKAAIDKQRQQIERRSGIESFLRIKMTGALNNQEVIDATKEWSEGVGLTESNLAETLKYFELIEQSFSENYPPEQKIETICALAEIAAEGHFDGETLQALAFRIIRRETGGSMNRVADYSRDLPLIGTYDQLWQDIDGQRQNITHILKHEVAHGADRYLEIGSDEEIRAAMKKMIADGNLRRRESWRSQNAIDQYLAAPDEEKEQMAQWLSGELLAEKIAIYLESGGEFSRFIAALEKVMPPEDLRSIKTGDDALKKQFNDENRFFFDKIQTLMADKTAVKEKIIANTASGRAKLAESSADQFDSDDYFDGGYFEPAQPAAQKSNVANGGEGLWGLVTSLGEVVKAAGNEIEQTIPVTEIAKKAT